MSVKNKHVKSPILGGLSSLNSDGTPGVLEPTYQQSIQSQGHIPHIGVNKTVLAKHLTQPYKITLAR